MATSPNVKALTASDGNQDYFNVNTLTGQVHIPNGVPLVMFSDKYITQTASIQGGSFASGVSATTPDPGAAGTINTAGVGVALITPLAARTGCILQAGTFNGQEVWVVNQGTLANSITWNATPGTSNVADAATAAAIPGLSIKKYVWVSAASLWYESAAVSALPPLILTSEVLAAASGSAVMTANTVYLYEYVLQVPVTATAMRWATGATAAGNVDAGIYDVNGNLLAHIGVTANTTANNNSNAALLGGNLALAPGKYYIAFTPGTSTDTFLRISGLNTTGSPMIPIFSATNGSTGTTSPVLPATTGGVALVGKCPFFAAAISGGI